MDYCSDSYVEFVRYETVNKPTAKEVFKEVRIEWGKEKDEKEENKTEGKKILN